MRPEPGRRSHRNRLSGKILIGNGHGTPRKMRRKTDTMFKPEATLNRRKTEGIPVWRWSARLTLMLLAIATLTLLLSGYVGWSLTHPAPHAVKDDPAQYQMAWRNVSFPSRRDHLRLPGWLIPGDGTDRIVIEAHGYNDNRADPKAMLPTAQALHQAGFSVLLFDFRGAGTAPKATVTVGLDEQNDLEGAIDYAAGLGYRQIGILGYSMGASTALEVASHDRRVKATVADSPFAALDPYLRTHLPVWSHLPNWPFTPEILWEMRVFENLDARRVDPLADLQHARPFPLLLIAGTADDKVPPQNSQELYREVQGWPHTSLWMVPGARHSGAWQVAPQQYTERVTTFFDQYVR